LSQELTFGLQFINTFVADVQYIRTSKSHIEHTLSCYFHATLQLHNPPGGWVRKLFKPSKDVVSLLDGIEKNLGVLDFAFL